MSLTRVREELRKQHAKVSARKEELMAVGDNGVSFTPVTDTWLWAIMESPSLQSLTLRLQDHSIQFNYLFAQYCAIV